MKLKYSHICAALLAVGLAACGGSELASDQWLDVADDDGFTRTISLQECASSMTGITNTLDEFSVGGSTVNGVVCEISIPHEEHGLVNLELWPRLYEVAVAENEEIRSSGDWDNEGAASSGQDYAFWPNPTCSFRVNANWGHISGIGIDVDQSSCRNLAADISEAASDGFGIRPNVNPEQIADASDASGADLPCSRESLRTAWNARTPETVFYDVDEFACGTLVAGAYVSQNSGLSDNPDFGTALLVATPEGWVAVTRLRVVTKTETERGQLRDEGLSDDQIDEWYALPLE